MMTRMDRVTAHLALLPPMRLARRLCRSPSVVLNALPVPERKSAMLAKLNWPVPSAKLLFRKRRYSPPAFAVWRPAAWVSVSLNT